MREALADAGQLAFVIGLAILGWGGYVYPPITLLMASLNLAFVLVCIACAIAVRLPRRAPPGASGRADYNEQMDVR